MDYQSFVKRARERAQNERHQARWNDGHPTVKSETFPGERYEQTFEITPSGALWIHCTCLSGVNRGHLLVPCKHATRWGDRMLRDIAGTIKLVDGIYWLADDAPEPGSDTSAALGHAAHENLRRLGLIAPPHTDDDDPFRGLPR